MIATRRSRRGLQRSSTRAQALAEFAIVVPIFFLILFAIIDFGRYVYYTQILNNAAREGTRYAIVHGEHGLPPTGPPNDASGADVIDVVRNYAIGVIGLEDTSVLDIQASWDPDNTRDSQVTVTIAYEFHSVMPLIPIPPITVRGASTLVINN
jgi:Flp pilus assembly protein TadG